MGQAFALGWVRAEGQVNSPLGLSPLIPYSFKEMGTAKY